MKKIYVVHPFGGKRQNMQAITHICQRLVNFGVMPISPIHSFSFLNDNIPEERNRSLEFCEELVSSANEIWFFGEWEKSKGCLLEKDTALKELVTIRVVKGWDDRGNPIFERASPRWLKLK